MKKKIVISFFIIFLIIIVGLLLIKITLDSFYNKEFNKFDYDKAKKITIKYLNKNEEQLKKIAEELYENKSSIEDPLENARYVGYYYDDRLNYESKEEYVKFDIDAQGMLGGQCYGLIYSKNNHDGLIKNKEIGGNNIFIRQKIKDNWYFYYDDYDGKVDVKKIK